jgi:hypothetical protein
MGKGESKGQFDEFAVFIDIKTALESAFFLKTGGVGALVTFALQDFIAEFTE